MSHWKCPEDWKYMPKAAVAPDGMLMSMLFEGAKRFQQRRVPWFRRCNASGKWIWPMQKAWRGIVGVNLSRRWQTPGDVSSSGSYKVVWLNEDQYLIQKLKGNI